MRDETTARTSGESPLTLEDISTSASREVARVAPEDVLLSPAKVTALEHAVACFIPSSQICAWEELGRAGRGGVRRFGEG